MPKISSKSFATKLLFTIFVDNNYNDEAQANAMNAEKIQKQAATEFAARWKDRGSEKEDSQRFWIDLLGNVYGIKNVTEFVRFEEKAALDNTSFIDVMIPSTKVMIEQKSSSKDLRKPIKQSDGTMLTPFQQARRWRRIAPTTVLSWPPMASP
jgi:hypothetical protein